MRLPASRPARSMSSDAERRHQLDVVLRREVERRRLAAAAHLDVARASSGPSGTSASGGLGTWSSSASSSSSTGSSAAACSCTFAFSDFSRSSVCCLRVARRASRTCLPERVLLGARVLLAACTSARRSASSARSSSTSNGDALALRAAAARGPRSRGSSARSEQRARLASRGGPGPPHDRGEARESLLLARRRCGSERGAATYVPRLAADPSRAPAPRRAPSAPAVAAAPRRPPRSSRAARRARSAAARPAPRRPAREDERQARPAASTRRRGRGPRPATPRARVERGVADHEHGVAPSRVGVGAGRAAVRNVPAACRARHEVPRQRRARAAGGVEDDVADLGRAAAAGTAARSPRAPRWRSRGGPGSPRPTPRIASATGRSAASHLAAPRARARAATGRRRTSARVPLEPREERDGVQVRDDASRGMRGLRAGRSAPRPGRTPSHPLQTPPASPPARPRRRAGRVSVAVAVSSVAARASHGLWSYDRAVDVTSPSRRSASRRESVSEELLVLQAPRARAGVRGDVCETDARSTTHAPAMTAADLRAPLHDQPRRRGPRRARRRCQRCRMRTSDARGGAPPVRAC